MPLKQLLIGGFNPFEWEHLTCPLCGGNQYTSVSGAGVYCDECNARFLVRDTAGDPGCVVDCFATKDQGAHVYAPAYMCNKCPTDAGGLIQYPRFDWEDKCCPLNMNHGNMTRQPRIMTAWKAPKDMEYFYLILKTGDYCSGWIGTSRPGCKRRGPTQAQWEEFQAVMA